MAPPTKRVFVERIDPLSMMPPELAEMLFLNMSLLDLVRATRVSNSWKAALEGSTKVQQVLFLQPYSSTVIKTFYKRNTARWTYDGGWKWETEQGRPLLHRPLFNPFLNEIVGIWAPYDTEEFTRNCSAFLARGCLNDHRYDYGHEKEYYTGVFACSLERMLPLQPPTRQIVSTCPDRVNSPDMESDEESEGEESEGEESESEDEGEQDEKEGGEREGEDEEREDEAGERGRETSEKSEGQDEVEEDEEEMDGDEDEGDEDEGDDPDDDGDSESGESGESEIERPDFPIERLGERGGFLRFGDMSNVMWNHWLTCRDECGMYMEEIEQWRWRGDHDVDVVMRDVKDVTGYEMLAEFERRFK